MKDTAVICYQKANPPTKAHEQLFKHLRTTAAQLQADPLVFLSQKYDAKQNPIPFELKAEYLKSVLPIYVCDDPQVENVEDVLAFLFNRKYKKVIFIMGLDHVKEMQDTLDRLNKDKENFNFDEIKVTSFGDHDPDTDIVDSDYSVAKARNAVLDNDSNAFSKIVLCRNNSDAQKLMSMMRTGIGITEHVTSKWRLV